MTILSDKSEMVDRIPILRSFKQGPLPLPSPSWKASPYIKLKMAQVAVADTDGKMAMQAVESAFPWPYHIVRMVSTTTAFFRAPNTYTL